MNESKQSGADVDSIESVARVWSALLVCERSAEFLRKVPERVFLCGPRGIFSKSRLELCALIIARFVAHQATEIDLGFLLRSEEEVTVCKFNHEWLISKRSLCWGLVNAA